MTRAFFGLAMGVLPFCFFCLSESSPLDALIIPQFLTYVNNFFKKNKKNSKKDLELYEDAVPCARVYDKNVNSFLNVRKDLTKSLFSGTILVVTL